MFTQFIKIKLISNNNLNDTGIIVDDSYLLIGRSLFVPAAASPEINLM